MQRIGNAFKHRQDHNDREGVLDKISTNENDASYDYSLLPWLKASDFKSNEILTPVTTIYHASIFKSTSISLPIIQNSLQPLYYGFTHFFNAIKPKEKLNVLKELDYFIYLKYMQNYADELAKTLMHCKEFAELPFNDKVGLSYKKMAKLQIILHKHSIMIFLYIERVYTSIVAGSEQKLMLVYENEAYEMRGSPTYDINGSNRESYNKAKP